jgi:hypothetical protein
MNTCDCEWTSDNGGDLHGSIGDALPGLKMCAGHMAACERAAREERARIGKWLVAIASQLMDDK